MSVFGWILDILFLLTALCILVAVMGVFGLSAAIAVILVLYALRKEKRERYKGALKVLLKILGAFLAAGLLFVVIYSISMRFI